MAETLIHKNSLGNLQIISVCSTAFQEFFITVNCSSTKQITKSINDLKDLLVKSNAAVVKFDCFGLVSRAVTGVLNKIPDMKALPLTWVAGDNGEKPKLFGMQVYAISGAPVQTIYSGKKPVARVFRNNEGTYCLLGGITGNSRRASEAAQAEQTFVNMEKALAKAGMRATDIVRTWFYNRDILKWYGAFNKIRNTFFVKNGVYKKLLPASTGIGGSNQYDTALIAGVLAIKPVRNRMTITELVSPEQCAAPRYGSSFSRAIEICTPQDCRVIISGTASIDRHGKTVHQGDIQKQIAQTMKVVASLLRSRGMNLSHVVRGIVYVEKPAYVRHFQEYCRKKLGMQLPVVVSCNTICRHDLLFEIEIDALAAR